MFGDLTPCAVDAIDVKPESQCVAVESVKSVLTWIWYRVVVSLAFGSLKIAENVIVPPGASPVGFVDPFVKRAVGAVGFPLVVYERGVCVPLNVFDPPGSIA